MVINARRGRQDGSSTVVILITVMVFLVLFASILDVCRVLIYREHTRNAADAISLAVAQEMIFFEYQEPVIIAEKIADSHSCRLESLSMDYDMVSVTIASEVELLFLNRFRHDNKWTVRSASGAKVTYPWDIESGLCRYYEFSFMDK
ncbi:TadE/TadG family type IV pilus assembly protein [Actinomycetota bacterium]